ncbi:MAG: hypothetical protein POELPBGB_03649 [Bacteroidia bacterium]|nr:hypothetical protein [Bacteroidia bacterium]
MLYQQDQTFDKLNHSITPLAKGEYEKCVFKNSDLSNSDLTEFKFIDCQFIACNVSLAKLLRTTLRDVTFKECKLLGLHFDKCNEFGLSLGFEDCNLNHSSFYKTKIKKTVFKNTQLHEVDFTECDLSVAVFDNCDLLHAKFDNTLLEKTDLRSAFNYSINPDSNRIKKARFSLSGVIGLLDKYDIDIER